MDSRKNVIKSGVSNVGLRARKGYTKFMYKDSTARDEYLGAIDAKIANNNATLEESKALKEAKKEEKLRLKAEREKERNEFAFGFKKRDFEPDEETETKPRRSWFSKITGLDSNYEEEDTELEMILTSQFRDADKKPYAKELKGRDLLKRDFESTPLYIENHGDFLKVTGAETIESNHAGVVTVVLSTYREDFLVDFPMDF